MTEQKIEKIVIDKFKSAFEQANIEDVQLVGTWQVAEEGNIKAFEDKTATGILAVKVYPRTYETPTIPDGQFQVDVSLIVRADKDATGQGYLGMTQLVSDILHAWQKSYASYAEDFAIENEFQPTGFNLESGEVGLDKEARIWQYTHTFILHGIIN